SRKGAMKISAMSRNTRWRRGFGAASAPVAGVRCRLLRSVIARATVIHRLRKSAQCVDITSKFHRLQRRMHQPAVLDIDPAQQRLAVAPLPRRESACPRQDGGAD